MALLIVPNHAVWWDMMVQMRVHKLEADGWHWIDALTSVGDAEEFYRSIPGLDRLDELALNGALHEVDLPKFDDFGDHVLIVLHGLDRDDVEICEIDCFVSAGRLLTVHSEESAALDAVLEELRSGRAVLPAAPMDLVASIADVVSRRHMRVVDLFDERADELMIRALEADTRVLADVAAIRGDLSEIRRSILPQRETIDELRHTKSALMTDAARRRFADAFDVTMRTTAGLDSARTALSETMDAYRGSEARRATDVSRVLTIYAAIMLPLSLVVGFFGMNHQNLPLIRSQWGWLAASGIMVAITAVSLGIFASVGWISMPSSRRAAAKVGRGLTDAVIAPVHAVGSLLTVTSRPLRSQRRTSTKSPRRQNAAEPEDLE